MTKQDRELLRPFFWDTDVSKLSLKKSRKSIIERVLKFGRVHHVKWMLHHFDDDEIIEVIRRSSNLDRRTANYWSLRYQLPKTQVRCFQKPSQVGYFI
jgi:hypothetical protein